MPFGPYLLPLLPPAAPLEPEVEPDAPPLGLEDAPLEAEPLPDCWRWVALPEPLALPDPLIPLPAPERAPLSLLPLLAFRPWLSPHAERASAIAAAITPIVSFFMIAPSKV